MGPIGEILDSVDGRQQLRFNWIDLSIETIAIQSVNQQLIWHQTTCVCDSIKTVIILKPPEAFNHKTVFTCSLGDLTGICVKMGVAFLVLFLCAAVSVYV